MKALARFDLATSKEIAAACNASTRTAWAQLKQLVARGLVESRGIIADYRLTPNGRIVARIQRRHVV